MYCPACGTKTYETQSTTTNFGTFSETEIIQKCNDEECAKSWLSRYSTMDQETIITEV